jgi:gluconolactonase
MRTLAFGLVCISLATPFACSNSSDNAQGDEPIRPEGGAAGAGTGGSSAMAGNGAGGGATMETPDDLDLAGNDAGGTAAAGTSGAGAGGSSTADSGAPPSLASVCPPGPYAANPVPAGATPAPVCGGMTFTEGPVWFAERNTLYFSDFSFTNVAANTSGRIMSLTPGGQCEVFIAAAGTNGLAIAPDGNLLGCRHSDRTLTVFDLQTQAPTVLIPDNAGVAFNSPNDVVVRSDGNLYFTDPTFLLGGRPSPQPARAYRRDPSGVLTPIGQDSSTNGIALSPDENRLYLARLDGGQNNTIFVYQLDEAGTPTNPQPFANAGSDGMAIDCAGNVYITQNGVQIFSSDGDPIGTINAPGAANIAFGGPDRRTLYITATEQLLAVELAIPGLPY